MARHTDLISRVLCLDLCQHALKSRRGSMLGYVIVEQGQHAVMCDERVVLSTASQGRIKRTDVAVVPRHATPSPPKIAEAVLL